MSLSLSMTDARPRFASVVLDVDSTITSLEGIDWLAGLRGDDIAREIAALTDRAMAGEISIESVYAHRLELIKPTRDEVTALGQAYIETVQPGARALCAVLSIAGCDVTLLSGGLRDAIVPLAAYMGIPASRVHAVSILFADDGRYVSLAGEQPLATQRGKPTVLHHLALPRPLVMVGDGATDAAVRGIADAFIAYTGVARRPTVVAVADAEAIDFATLHALLFQP